jgi:uncharacterized protein (DUF58 family)
VTPSSTVRLPVAVLVTATAALAAVLGGRVDVALLAAPWFVVLVLGLSRSRATAVTGSVACDVSRVVTGETVTVTATVSGVSGLIQATVRPSAEFGANQVGGPTPMTDVAAPDGATEFRFELLTSTWGTHDVGRIDLEITQPYGLLRRHGLLHVPSEVRVHPRAVDIQRLLAPHHVRRLSGGHRSPATGRGIEYADIRPFTYGDSVRDINWRISARSDDLWVSQRHPERSTDVVLLLDTFVESGHDITASLGLAIEAALSLAESHLTASDRVGLVELGGIMRWVTPGAGRHQLQRLADALLATRLYENASDRPVSMVPPRALPPRSFIVALSPLLDERFLESLAVLRGAGHDVSVIEVAPFPDDTESDSGGEQYSPAGLAGRLWLVERVIARDRLAQQGVPVGRWHPGDSLHPVLADLAANRRLRTIGDRRG